jgi:hypothetical protein
MVELAAPSLLRQPLLQQVRQQGPFWQLSGGLLLQHQGQQRLPPQQLP